MTGVEQTARAEPRPGAYAGLGAIDLALIGTAVVWGANFVVIKAAVQHFLPLTFTALRFAVATLALVALAAARGWPKLGRRDLARLGLLGLVSNVAYQPLYVVGLAHTTTGNSALIIASTPALVAVLGHLLRQERLSARAWAGVALSFAGLAVFILGGPEAVSLAPGTLLGNGLTLAAAAAWALGTLITQRLVVRHPPLAVTAISSLMAVPPLLLITAPALRAQDWAAISAGAWLALAGSGLLAISLAYVVWAYGVQRLGSARTAVYANLIPVVAALSGVVVLGEALTATQVLAAAAVLGGIGLARGRR